jgi:PKD repeat protein
MNRFRVYWLTCVLMFVGSVASRATTIIVPTDDQLVAKSSTIIEGTVVSSTPIDRGGRIWTETRVSVSDVLKGDGVVSEAIIREIGGRIDNRITVIFGAPTYKVGESVLCFLVATPRGDYQTADLFVGKFTAAATRTGSRVWVRDENYPNTTLLNRDFQPLQVTNAQRDGSRFETFVRNRVAGVPALQDYAVSNEAVLKSSANGFTTSPDFTVISEPDIYRWFAFDSGTSVSWSSIGTQPGYAGGGVNEISTAMAAWTGYSGARILYKYAGATTRAPGGNNTPNGFNEIDFNDPLGEIAGSWNPSTGGVVGQGGFNGVSASRSWTSPFAGDPAHPQKTYQAFNITEGNLVIQDNVSSNQGIPSATLAEIVAHEFGHTLGFGHSTDSTALMYPTVTGLGPSLRPDDQLAARWLYPSGTTTTQPPPAPIVPNAPSVLTATVAGTSVTLSWHDNATDETSQTVFMASGTGSFASIGSVAANVTSGTISNLAAGSYRFYVIASNAAGQSAPSTSVTATVAAVPGPSIAASFTYSPSAPTTAQTVSFVDQSTGGVLAWSWSFGDGTGSTLESPTHRFTVAGNHTVTLTASAGTQSATASRVVTVTNSASALPPVGASFTATPSAPLAGQQVQFLDQSTGSPTTWSWTFGDGATSTARNPTHAYAAQGTYNVTLSASNGQTSATSSATVLVAGTSVAFRSLISAAAQTSGIGGSVWRTELTLFNAGPDSANLTLVFVPGAGGAVLSRSLVLGPMQTTTYANALLDLFAMSSGAGAITIEATSPLSSPQIKVTSRTFTNGSSGTYGQSVPDVSNDDLQRTVYLTGLQANADYRTNIGLVNRSAAAVGATLSLYDSAANRIATKAFTLPPQSFQQSGVVSYFPELSGRTLSGMWLELDSDTAGAASAYASIVDNRTQDPIYVQAVAPSSGSGSFVPVVGRASGANGTFWRSDVTMFNPGASALTVSLRYLANGIDNRGASSRSLTIGPRQSTTLSDVSTWLGAGDGNGALQVSWSGASGPVVTSRTYTSTTAGGTFGQSIDPIRAAARDSVVTGLRSDSSYRSNLGLVNTADQAISVALSIVSPSGQTVGTTNVTVQAKSAIQASVSGLFPALNAAALGSFTLEAHTDSAASLFAYGSIIDNLSGDPVFFGGK